MTGPGSSRQSQAFGLAAMSYDRYRPAPALEILDWLLRPADQDVLDVGAGTGQLTRLLCARGVSVTAVEPDPGMRAELALGVPGARITAGTAERLPVAAGSQDAVLSHAAWHWFRPWRASVEAARVLRPGGRLAALRTEIDPSVEWLGELWARLEPDPAGRRPGGRAPGSLRGWGSVERARDAILFGVPGAPFARRERHAVSFARRFATEELVGLMGTYSGLLVRPVEEQRILLGRVSDLVSSRVAEEGSVEVPMLTHAWRAERRGQPLHG